MMMPSQMRRHLPVHVERAPYFVNVFATRRERST
jgi:hypothetical protein